MRRRCDSRCDTKAIRLAAVMAFAFVGGVSLATPARAQYFNGVFSRDGLDVIALADSGALYRSVSGGALWLKTTLGTTPLRDAAAWDWNIVVVGDGGRAWRSTDLGGTWTRATVSGAPDLRRVERL